MLLRTNAKGSGNFAETYAAARMGLRQFGPNGDGSTEKRQWFALAWSQVQGALQRKRPSHSARGWAGHYKRWADNSIVPIPMSRGIPFRGDRFGGPFYAAANLSATGT